MKGGTAALKSQMKLISLDEVEDGLDDMAELLEDANEIQEAMGRSYGIDEDIDISELDAELDAIECAAVSLDESVSRSNRSSWRMRILACELTLR